MDTEFKEYRLDKGYTLKQLSEITGVSASYLGKIERGCDLGVSLDIVDKIAEALNEDFVKMFYIILNSIKTREN